MIADDMPKYGCREKWTKGACQKKWDEMHPDDAPYIPEYERMASNSSVISPELKLEVGTLSWPDGRGSGTESMYEGDSGTLMSSISTATMDEVRSRAASDTSLQMQRYHHHQQQQNGYRLPNGLCQSGSIHPQNSHEMMPHVFQNGNIHHQNSHVMQNGMQNIPSRSQGGSVLSQGNRFVEILLVVVSFLVVVIL